MGGLDELMVWPTCGLGEKMDESKYTVKFECPGCGVEMESKAHEQVTCPECGQQIFVDWIGQVYEMILTNVAVEVAE
jgi:DNA-directed RNA polymerase subunit RPC12/RpoP